MKRQLINADRLPHRVGVTKQVLANGIANDGYVVGRLNIVLGKVRTLCQRPGADIQVLRLGAGDARVPVVIAKDDLRGSSCARSYYGNSRALAPDGRYVIVEQGFGISPAQAHTTLVHGAGANIKNVRSHSRDLPLYLLLSPLS